MNEYRQAVATKTAELIGKGWKIEAAAKRARKACRHLHLAHRTAVARNLAHADARFEATGKTDSYNTI